jgi:hypothetical protein
MQSACRANALENEADSRRFSGGTVAEARLDWSGQDHGVTGKDTVAPHHRALGRPGLAERSGGDFDTGISLPLEFGEGPASTSRTSATA